MKELKRFLRRHRKQIITYSILILSLAIILLTAVYMFSDGMNGAPIFFLVAMLMVALALHYNNQKKVSKGVLIFYYVTAAACVIIGVLMYVLPTPVV